MKTIGLGCLILILLWTIGLPGLPGLLTNLSASAAPCRTLHQQTVCIQEIKRSAKYFWEYRVTLQIDGKTQPLEIYNCRDRLKIQPDGSVIPFEPAGIGEFICKILQR
ncbi:MAG TPA: hypothetical protein V6C65_01760 [Allocoleopsis sp.]